jgi:hypothetical protein
MPLGWFSKRKARDLAEEIKSSDHDDKVREFPLGFTIAIWAVKLFLWLLAKHPNLIHLALDKFLEFSQKQESDDRFATKAAVDLLRDRVTSSPQSFAAVMATE